MSRMPKVQDTCKESSAAPQASLSTLTKPWPWEPPFRAESWLEMSPMFSSLTSPSFPRYRDPRRRVHQADQQEHDNPHKEVAGVLHRCRWPDPGGVEGAPGREGDGKRQQASRTIPADWNPPGATWCAPD